MIFVTTGTQLPFDRLVAGVDAWQARHANVEVFGQIGPSRTAPSFPYVDYLRGRAFEQRMQGADLVVSHAGIGTILTCWSLGKPLIVMPRRHDLGEHRNDHQLATVAHLGQVLSLAVAQSVEELDALLSRPWSEHVPQRAKGAAAGRISDFVNALPPAARA